MRQWSLNAEDDDRVVLQSLDGASRIAIGDAIVKITAPAVEIVSDTLTHNGVNVGSDHMHSTATDPSGPPE
jgi:hypothetical protein